MCSTRGAEGRRTHTFGIVGYFAVDTSGAQHRITHTSISVYPLGSLASFPAQPLRPKRKPVSPQLENGLCSAHTHTHTENDSENKTSFPALLPACRLAARLSVQARAQSLMRPGPLVRMKELGKGAQSPSDCRRSISENHILKNIPLPPPPPPSSGRYSWCREHTHKHTVVRRLKKLRVTRRQRGADARGLRGLFAFEGSGRLFCNYNQRGDFFFAKQTRHTSGTVQFCS